MSTRCRSKVFPCPAGERCPEHRGVHQALDYSIVQKDFNRFLDVRNRILPGGKPSAEIEIVSRRFDNPMWEEAAYAQAYKSFAGTFDKGAKSAVYYYTEGDLHRVINHWLRNGREIESWPDLDREVLTNLDRLTTGDYRRDNPDAPLWRGVSGTYAEKSARYKVGQVFEEPAFTSTSIDPLAVKVFTNESEPVIFQIFTAKGIPVSRRTEAEYLLPRGMRFKVEGKRRVNLNVLRSNQANQYKFENALLITLREVED